MIPKGRANKQWKRVNSKKKVREKSSECHNHKPQPFPDTKRKRKLINLNKHKSNKRTKSAKISSLFPKRGNCNAKGTEKRKNKKKHKVTTQNKSPRRTNQKATKSKTNTGTTALERPAEKTTMGFKVLLQLVNYTLGPDATLNTEIHKKSVRIKAPNPTQSMHQSENTKIKLITIINKDEYSWLILLYARVNENPWLNHSGPNQRYIVKPQPNKKQSNQLPPSQQGDHNPRQYPL